MLMRKSASLAVSLTGKASVTTFLYGQEALNFEDHAGAFGHRTNWELFRALVILKLCGVRTISDHSLELLHWSRRLLGNRCTRLLLKPTLYEHFVGGETSEELRMCMRKVGSEGMRSMLAATMEEDIGDAGRSENIYDSNCKRILHVIQIAGEEAPKAPMIQLKLSGLLSAPLLVKLSVESNKNGMRLKMIEAVADILMSDSTNSITRLENMLDDGERKSLLRATLRLKSIGEEAMRRGVKVLVDAEYTYMNPGLSVLTLAAVAAFNKNGSVFWNTYQCYLKDTPVNITDEYDLITGHFGKPFGAKVVRGAYMVQERARARQVGSQDPVCDDYNATCKNFNSIISDLLEKSSADSHRCQFIAATHNEESIQFGIQRMKELNIDKTKGNVSFGQLYGMCDQVSNTLTKAGYAVYKSIPYGTVEEVLPYLARRAIENRSVLERAQKENKLLAQEIKHRMKKYVRK